MNDSTTFILRRLHLVLLVCGLSVGASAQDAIEFNNAEGNTLVGEQ
ncbi:MAG: hypothetical protein J6386_17715 [Candidatus Synoicihabitans palmerolidicus]|nr:hypothetical protein [Candidatus Synoicihabitans palmerolidicus]